MTPEEWSYKEPFRVILQKNGNNAPLPSTYTMFLMGTNHNFVNFLLKKNNHSNPLAFKLVHSTS